MQITTPQGPLELAFAVGQARGKVYRRKAKRGETREQEVLQPSTTCTIYQVRKEGRNITLVPVSSATVRCSPSDSYDPFRGQRLALERALEEGQFERELRGHVWQSYNAQVPPTAKPEVLPVAQPKDPPAA